MRADVKELRQIIKNKEKNKTLKYSTACSDKFLMTDCQIIYYKTRILQNKVKQLKK